MEQVPTISNVDLTRSDLTDNQLFRMIINNLNALLHMQGTMLILSTASLVNQEKDLQARIVDEKESVEIALEVFRAISAVNELNRKISEMNQS